MAKGKANPLLKGISGKIGKEFILKQYADKTVVTKYPVMPKEPPTDLQKIYETRFSNAVKYARAICRKPHLKKLYEPKLRPGQRVYNFAISEYLAQTSSDSKEHERIFTDIPMES